MIIYQALNLVNGKIYIGKSKRDLEHRKQGHIKAALKNSRLVFHRAIRKYGADKFEWMVICNCINSEDLCEKEILYIKRSKDEGKTLYNQTDGGDGFRGHHTAEACKKIGDAQRGKPSKYKGKKHSEETKRRLSNLLKGRKLSLMTEETKRKISLSLIGRKQTLKTKRKRAQSMRGRVVSPETRLKISLAQKGIPKSLEQKLKISMTLTGKKATKKTRMKLKRLMKGRYKGKIHTLKSRKNMSEAHKKYVYEVISPLNEMFVIYNMKEFCKKHQINQGSFEAYIRNNKEYLGWRCKRHKISDWVIPEVKS